MYYAMYSPNVTWDFVMEHYKEIKKIDGYHADDFFGGLSRNTFGKQFVSKEEAERRKKRKEFLRTKIIPDLANIISEYEY